MHHQTPLSLLQHPLFENKGIEVWMKRDDKNHPNIQGNKWHKLKYNLQNAQKLEKTELVTFGGAYSNHLAATAAAGKLYGFKTYGYIRGNELANQPEKWSSTLVEAQKNGMILYFLTREAYRQKQTDTFLTQLKASHPNAYFLPEGGSNDLAVSGFDALCDDLENQCPFWTHLITAVGTGGTLAGLIANSRFQKSKEIIGVSTLKDSDYLKQDIDTWLENIPHPHNTWRLLQNYHGGGYAKSTSEMQSTQAWFEKTFGILLDPIYTQKMVYGFMQELQADYFKPGSKIVLYHSGGLQGRLKNSTKN